MQNTMEQYFPKIPKTHKQYTRSHAGSNSRKASGHSPVSPSGKPYTHHRRPDLANLAAESLAAIKTGSYAANGSTYILGSATQAIKALTQYYPPDSALSDWSTQPPSQTFPDLPKFSVLEISTLEAATLASMSAAASSGKVGVLNFASAKNPGGGFLTGAQAQEETIARSSNLYPSLMTATAQQFYTLHNKDPQWGYYSHAMIYSPGTTIFRNDGGDWIPPIQVDVLTSPAVNAGVVRNHHRRGDQLEAEIAAVMKERMARLLYLFEKEGATHLVLGSFGTGVFKNDVPTIATIWAELLLAPDARFRHSFEEVIFGIIGRKNFTDFESTWNSCLSVS
ncbi:hypothetical protein DL96DRAFT_1062382 [Flagelloscypha sp. PMI_526]|nr:hypothetical protein DL96DRAFT_1062382 [Flagelloscypha sp. PMI_526]